MKTLHFSKFSLFMISIVVFAIGVFAVIVYDSPSNVTKGPERIYLHVQDHYKLSEGYVKIGDLKPNSFGYFMYPSSYNYSDNANVYQKFQLIRLPAWLGGDKNDISSYRAYSMLDVESHCLVKYWPEGGRQRIEDPCHFETYRIIDGASYYYGVNFLSKPIENALPKLDLGVDNDGFIYVKTPTWDVDKNGLVGQGRHLSKEQILNSSSFMLERYKSTSKNNFTVPLSFEDGEFLIELTYDESGAHFRYGSEKPVTGTGLDISIVYCNCTDPSGDHSNNYFSNNYLPKNTETWQIGNHLVYAYDSSAQSNEKPQNIYNFQFYKNGYHVSFSPSKSFDEGLKMLIESFFNGTNISGVKQISVGSQ